jgi:hypothetical protein
LCLFAKCGRAGQEGCKYFGAKNASIFWLSLPERLRGVRVSDPPVKAGAERKKKTAGLFLE